jgi:tripartite-type tricarboxylate transporter receptor subunit TctC
MTQKIDDQPMVMRTMAPPGASQDLLLRALQPIYEARFGAPIDVVNSPGRDGVAAALLALADAADGRHLLVTTGSTLTYYPDNGPVGFTLDDFEPLLGVGRYNFVFITGADRPWPDMRALLDRVRRDGRALRYVGSGEPDSGLAAAIAKHAGVAIEIAYKNGPALLDAVLSGEADLGLGTGTHQALLAAGRLRVLVQLHPRADRGTGAAPMPRDLGIDAVLDNFILISTRRGMPAGRRDRLIDRLSEALAESAITTLLAQRLLMSPALLRGAELADALATQRQSFETLRAEKPRGEHDAG